MKKRCTPTNNAINICCPVECPEPVVSTTTSCIDPLTYTFNLAVANSITAGISVEESFDLILNGGLVLTKDSNICCPPCGLFSFASVEESLKLYEPLGWTNANQFDKLTPCCYNISATVETNAKFHEELETPISCCVNDFTKCIDKLSNYVLINTIQAKGIVETNTLGSTSVVCTIVDLFNSIEDPAYTTGSFTEIMSRILDKGFVAFCCDCDIVIASIETFLKWFEANLDKDCFNQEP